MKTEEKRTGLNVSQASARGTCPVCAVLKEEQATFIEEVGVSGVEALCNIHAWAFAKSEGGRRTAQIFLRLMNQRSDADPAHEQCTVCIRLAAEEVAREAEIVTQMERGSYLDWMLQNGCFCRKHGERISTLAPSHLRPAINGILERYRRELKEELEAFLQLERGDRSGGGVLGRAAEFLTAQRGIGP